MSNRSVRRTIAITATAAIGLSSGLGLTGASVAAPASKSVSLPGDHPSTERALVDLLAGSPQYLVYVRTGQLPAGGHVQVPAIDGPWTHLFVRDAAGHTRNLGHAPSGLAHEMSISGSMLTGQADGGSAKWWDLSSHRNGQLRIPSGYSYESASPTGAVIAKGDQLFRLSTTGKLKKLGKPLRKFPDLATISSSNGVVVFSQAKGTAQTAAAYIPFEHPKQVTYLKSGTHLGLDCSTVDAIAVACGAVDRQGGRLTVELIPLNGHSPTTVKHADVDFNSEIALNGREAIWGSDGKLSSAGLGQGKITSGPKRLVPIRYNLAINGTDPYPDIRQFGNELISGLGGAIETQHHDKQVTLATSVSHGRRLFGAPRSPATASTFMLNDGQVAFASDQAIGGMSTADFSTYTSKVTSKHGAATLSSPSLLHAGSDYTLAGVSDSVTVFATRAGQEHADLVITYQGTSHTIQHVAFDSYLAVSGTKVMYASDRSSEADSSVYDAATGSTTTVDTDSACCDPFQGTYYSRTPALSGDDVYYLKDDGSVWQHDLTNGTETQLSDPVANPIGGIVFAAGDHVAWTNIYGPNSGPDASHSSAYVDLRSSAAPVRVNERIIGVSNAGVLTTTSNISYGSRSPDFTGSFSLRTFSGHRTELLSNRSVYKLPQIDGHSLAWINAAGKVMVKAL